MPSTILDLFYCLNLVFKLAYFKKENFCMKLNQFTIQVVITQAEPLTINVLAVLIVLGFLRGEKFVQIANRRYVQSARIMISLCVQFVGNTSSLLFDSSNNLLIMKFYFNREYILKTGKWVQKRPITAAQEVKKILNDLPPKKSLFKSYCDFSDLKKIKYFIKKR